MSARDELVRVLSGIRAVAMCDAVVPERLIKEVDEAREHLKAIPTGDLTSDQLWEIMLEWREIEKADACGECGGSGKKTYANTATYHGGVGGMMLTSDVCNRCWGSGDQTKPWPARLR